MKVARRMDAVYGFGPTPDDVAAHWYELAFDGSTGAEVLADRIDLHLTDSARGDHDLTANGRIVALLAPTIVGTGEGSYFCRQYGGRPGRRQPRAAQSSGSDHPGQPAPRPGSCGVQYPAERALPGSHDPACFAAADYYRPDYHRRILPNLGQLPATADAPALPLIELDGSLLDYYTRFPPHGAVGLHITAGHSLVQGLVINRFLPNNWGDNGIAILLQTVGDNVIQGNWLGTSYDGAFAHDNNFTGYGVVIEDCPNNQVGGVAPAARNVISGHHIGIDIRGEAADRNLAQGNYIGTNVTGAYIPNGHLGWLGIRITDGADENLIGGTVGTTPGGRASGAANVIAGNTYGVFEDGADGGTVPRNNTIQGNYIGTDVTGKGPLGNSYGVTIRGSDSVVGGTTAAARNLLSGNYRNGIELYPDGAIVQGNFIGTDVSGTRPLGNGEDGIRVVHSSGDLLIGGDTPGAGNVISASGGSGIDLVRKLHGFLGNGDRDPR